MQMSYLIKIDPDKITADNNNVFLGLSLIRNDLSDLVYLQGLHANENKKLDLKDKEVSAIAGQAVGRNIYIFRLALSLLYSSLEFFYTRRKQISSSDELKIILLSLPNPEKETWKSFLKMANILLTIKKINEIDEDTFLNNKNKRILKLCYVARNNITYHYHGAVKHLKDGYLIAYSKRDSENSSFAFATDKNSINEDRSYYIDLSIQKYLENKVGSHDLLKDNQDDFLKIIADLNAVISSILTKYHANKA